MSKTRMTGPQRRARILNAALEVFAAKGYQATVLGDIAEAAGIARSVLYDHFPNKRVLLLTVMNENNAALVEYVGSRITGQGSAEDRMRATIEAYFSFAEQHPQARRLLFDRIDEDDEEIRIVRWGIREARTRAVIVLLAPDIRKLGLPAEGAVTEAAVELLIAGLDGVAQWWERHQDVSREALVTSAMRVLWTGLGHGLES
jgi:AcrR family transcriptional regulator